MRLLGTQLFTLRPDLMIKNCVKQLELYYWNMERSAHLDRVNKNGKTALDVWIGTRKRIRAATIWIYRPIRCRTVPKLMCLSARCVCVHKIPYIDFYLKSNLLIGCYILFSFIKQIRCCILVYKNGKNYFHGVIIYH